jgi:hypothetical protein
VPLARTGGAFSGTLTGGNGRFGAPGQTLSYQFDVPSGLRDLDLGLRIVDPSSNLEGVLIDPYGQPIDVQTMAGAIGTSGQPSYLTGTMQFFRLDPVAGRWLFVLLINDTVGSAATAQPFQATIGFNGVLARGRGLPAPARCFVPAGLDQAQCRSALHGRGPCRLHHHGGRVFKLPAAIGNYPMHHVRPEISASLLRLLMSPQSGES